MSGATVVSTVPSVGAAQPPSGTAAATLQTASTNERAAVRAGRWRMLRGVAGLVMTLTLGLPVGARAQSITLTASPGPLVDQNSGLTLLATVNSSVTSPAPPCYVPPQQPGPSLTFACNWTWSVSGGGTLSGQSSSGATSASAVFNSQYSPGQYTVTVSRYGLPSASLQVSVNPLSIGVSGPQQLPQGESGRFTATLAGIQTNSLGNTDVNWLLGAGGGTLVPDSPECCNTQMATVTAGLAAGTYLLTAQSVQEPAVSGSLVLTVLPPPVASISPTSAVAAAGQPVTFTGSAINTSDPTVRISTDDGDGVVNMTNATTGVFQHRVGFPGGQFHVTATSERGGTPATATVSVVAVTVSPPAITVPPGTSRQFFAEVTGSQQATQWTTTVPGTTLSPSGLLQVPSSTPAGSYLVSAQTVGAPVATASAAVSVASTIPVSGVAVSPARSVIDSGQQEPFSAVVEGQAGEPHPNQQVSWSVAGPTPATISASGLFTAPLAPGVYTVRATAQADATKTGAATVTVGEDLMVSPSSASLAPGASQLFAVQVSGVANPSVAWSVGEGAAGGTVSAGGLYTAPASAGVYHVAAVSSAGGGTVQGMATVVVGTSPQMSVQVSPVEVQLNESAQQQFSAVVAGSADPGVVWSASAGTIDGTGLFTAPAGFGTVTVTATSHADPSVRASATVVISDPSRAQAFTYDANGNLLGDGLRTFEWDAENRLTAINLGSHRTEFGYDGLGRRVMIVEKDNGAVTAKRHDLWVGDQIAEERDATATAATIPTATAAFSATGPEPPAGNELPLAGAPQGDPEEKAAAATAGDNAVFVSQSAPSAMVVGGVYSVAVTLKNTGVTTWTAAGNYRLGSLNPPNNGTWGPGRVYLAAGEAIAPGQQKTFTFNVTAPAAAGNYNFQWQLLQEGVAWIGDPSLNVSVPVAAGTAANLAQFIAQSVPTTMIAGAVYTVSVTLQNAGTNVWTPSSNHHLGAQNPQDNSTWGTGRVFLAAGDAIAQGQQKVFTFTVKAPATAGTYNFQWRMVQEGVAWFGDLTPDLQITVIVPPEPVLARFFPGGMQSGGVNYYFSYDHLGSVREVTDASGAVVSRYDYDPYGRLTVNQGVPPRFGFAGLFHHAPSGLDLAEYRAYDPDLGRWESRDPVEDLVGASPYPYAGSDPENFVDPLGLMKLPSDPSGLPPEWTPVGQWQGGPAFENPAGGRLVFHPGIRGGRHWQGVDHWHYYPDPKNPDRKWFTKWPDSQHLRPGVEIPWNSPLKIECIVDHHPSIPSPPHDKWQPSFIPGHLPMPGSPPLIPWIPLPTFGVPPFIPSEIPAPMPPPIPLPEIPIPM